MRVGMTGLTLIPYRSALTDNMRCYTGTMRSQVDENDSFVSNNNILIILCLNTYYDNWINKISIAAFNETSSLRPYVKLESCITLEMAWRHYAGGPRRPPPPQLHLRRSRDLAHTSIPLAQTPWGLTGRAWLQAGAQQAVIAVDPSFKSLGIDSRNGLCYGIVTVPSHTVLWNGVVRAAIRIPHL